MNDAAAHEPVVTLEDVSQRFVTDAGDVVHALAETDLRIPQGQFVSVVGPSGCGKTTLLKIIAGFLTPTGGTARYRGTTITKPGAERGVVFQQPNLYPWYSVRDNVALGMRMRKVGKKERAERRSGTSTWWGSATSATPSPTSCPAGCSSAHRSPACSPTRPT